MLDLQILEELKEKILFSILEKNNSDYIEKAKKMFLLELDDDIANGFTNWLIHDFSYDGIKAVDLYKKSIATSMDKYIKDNDEAKDYLDVISGSLFSFFDLVKTENNVILKDIITRKDYLLSVSDFEISESLVVGRIYFDEDKVILSEEHTLYSESFKDVFRKGILEKYNDYIRVHGIIEIEDFVKDNSSIFYKFIDVVNDADAAVNFDDEDFSVHQSVYALKNRANVIAILDKVKDSIKEEYDEDESTYIIKLGEMTCEIIVLKDKLELECLNQYELDIFKEKIGNLLDGNMIYMKDEVLTIDQML